MPAALGLILRGRLSGAQRAARYGLVSAWNLNEASGQALDAYGSNALTDNNTVTSNPGKIGTARQFTAANLESLSIVDNAALSVGDIDFWIAAWAKLDSVGTNRDIVAKFLTTLNHREYGLNYASASTRFRFLVSNDGAATITVLADTFGAPSTATYYFLMAYHDAVNNAIKLSVNGGAFDSTAHATGVKDDTSDFVIGARSDATAYWDGCIDAVAFGKSPPLGIGVLANEIRDYLYNGGAGRDWPWT